MNVLLSKIKIEPTEEPKEKFDIFEFRKTILYKSLEQANIIGEGLEFREEDGKSFLDLDTNSGSQVCASFLSCLERLLTNAFNKALGSKDYRNTFANSYRSLFKRK